MKPPVSGKTRVDQLLEKQRLRNIKVDQMKEMKESLEEK
jgi:hypothetical protein